MDRIKDVMDEVVVSEKLAAAREYETKNEIAASDRPSFHVTPAVGWMNDPNGFSVYGGRIHLLYQYHPYSTEWGPMHWGHQVTDDMMKWEQLPVAMAPDTEYDAEGCFSGTAVELDGKHVLVYTSVMKKPEGEGVFQNQSIAVGDGITYKKIDGNPVVTGDMLPDGLSRVDFRDPKVWYDNDRYYMAAGCVDQSNKGLVVLFSSSDLGNWTFKSILARNDRDLGGVWECPDFFKMGDCYVLLVSPTGMQADGYEFHNGNNSVYFVGEFDKESGKFDGEKAYSLDYGTDFYAPQTTLLPDGRRILIAWMDSWHNLWIPDGQRWQGMMTLPREISVKNGMLIQNPIREIEKYYDDTVVYSEENVSGHRTFEGICGRYVDMTVTVKGAEYDNFTVELAKGDRYSTRFTYSRRDGLMELDRSLAGFERDVVCIRKAKVKTCPCIDVSGCGDVSLDSETYNDVIKLRFILDRNSIELFVNDGLMTMSTMIYTPIDFDRIEFSCDGKAVIDIEKHSIKIKY